MRGWMCSHVSLEVYCYSFVSIAILGVHRFIIDCDKLKVMALVWHIFHTKFREIWKTSKYARKGPDGLDRYSLSDQFHGAKHIQFKKCSRNICTANI